MDITPNNLIPIVEKIATDTATQIVNDKLKEAQFTVPKVPDHHHNGTDSSKINQSDLTPGNATSGRITMATDATTYTIRCGFTPSSVSFSGFALHYSGGVPDIRGHCIGSARLGPSFYLQPDTSTNVTVGGIQGPFVQSSSTLVIDSTSTIAAGVKAYVSEGHIVYAEYPAGTVVVTGTISAFGDGKLQVVTSLASGWQILGNWEIT